MKLGPRCFFRKKRKGIDDKYKDKVRANGFSSRHRYSIEAKGESVLKGQTFRPSVICVRHAGTQEKLSYDTF